MRPAGAVAQGWTGPCMMGIDEAGRGPVLGPMVYACAYCPLAYKEELATKSYADSKTLTEERRESLYAAIEGDANLNFLVDSLSAQSISARMLSSNRESLNAIANAQTFNLIREALESGIKLEEVYVDTVGDAEVHRQRLSREFPVVRFTVCPKADALYPIVSAASIVAKVTRDCSLKAHECTSSPISDTAYGSGYPGAEWLERNCDQIFGFPDVVRFSWQTAQRILDERAIKVSWACEDEFGVDAGQQRLNFGTKPAQKHVASTGMGRHAFFRSRRLQQVELQL